MGTQYTNRWDDARNNMWIRPSDGVVHCSDFEQRWRDGGGSLSILIDCVRSNLTYHANQGEGIDWENVRTEYDNATAAETD